MSGGSSFEGARVTGPGPLVWNLRLCQWLHSQETMANWPDQKDQPEYWEEIEKEQKTLKLSCAMQPCLLGPMSVVERN